jgi:hypothetical protein
MPYALVAADERRLFAGFANGQIWQSRDSGDSWHSCTLDPETLTRLDALAYAGASAVDRG